MKLIILIFIFISCHICNCSSQNPDCKALKNETEGFKHEQNCGFPANIKSDKIEFIDQRRAVIRNLVYTTQGPFAYWSIRLKNAGHGVNSNQPLDQLGDYRDNPVVGGGIPGEKERVNFHGFCERPRATPEDKTENITIILPNPHRWKDVAWLGIYDYGYRYVYNFVWINKMGEDNKFECLPEPCWVKREEYHLLCKPKIDVCKNTTLTCPANTEETYCYFDCTKNTGKSPSDCGMERRNKNELFGCAGKAFSDQIDKNKLELWCGQDPENATTTTTTPATTTTTAPTTTTVGPGPGPTPAPVPGGP